MYDYHVYTTANDMFSRASTFDRTSRNGPKAFVSEYAVTGKDAGTGSLLAALAEAGFLIGLEKNSDVIEMVSYAPLFVNANDRRWNPDAIVFNSSQAYGTPSYWVQLFFSESSGATLLSSSLQSNSSSNSVLASAITFQSSVDNKNYIRIKIQWSAIFFHLLKKDNHRLKDLVFKRQNELKEFYRGVQMDFDSESARQILTSLIECGNRCSI